MDNTSLDIKLKEFEIFFCYKKFYIFSIKTYRQIILTCIQTNPFFKSASNCLFIVFGLITHFPVLAQFLQFKLYV